ncbi:hypothetical protein INS49_005612 [Diaporthe citri]|uniref:uncharacterized protein n=1 Tax=Diaporthe citri TaxID=83186 RepID=UPI001C80CF8D|nr:uncharacterized protein INS49_005612 [Diaporthe citri]KAG6353431.1 hypothetical protein INS49_005612 [Diaporthe citri]
MSDLDYAMRVVHAVQDSAEQTYSALHRMKTPQAAFEERQAAVNVSIDQALNSHHSAQSCAEADRFREDILRHSAELHQLRQDHQATLDAKNKDFEHQRRLAIEDLCRRLIHAVGPDLIQSAIRNLTKNPSDATSSNPTPANQPTPPATEPEPEVVCPAEHPARSPPASPERPVRADASASSKRKRTRTDTEPESHGRRKRTAPTGKKISVMWFDEVYQEGHAETKHIIVEHPKGTDQWYIIRCQHCPRDFKDTPLRTAGSHLHSSEHGYQPRDATHIVENFGIAVLDCNKELAEKNNAVARRAFRRQEKEGPRPPDDTAASGSRHGRRGGGDIVSPTPGQIYLGYWVKAKRSWPVLLLPTANLEDVGVPETLESLGLLEKLPPCYRCDTTTSTLEWEEGFEDGGAKVAQRWFPVMFFDDGMKFPSESEVAWLAAKDLDVLDIESTAASDIPHIRSVRAYLRARAQTSSEADPPSEMDVHNDAISRRNDETHHTPEVDQSNLPEPIIVEPWTTRVKAGLVPVVDQRSEPIRPPTLETWTGAAGNSNDNLRRNSFDIISISSTPASESHETHFDEAAVPSPNKLNITTSAPDADVETTTSTDMSVNNPDPVNQANTMVEATVEPHHSVPNLSAEPAEVSESRADYLAIIAQNGLKKKLELSDSIPPGTVKQVAPRCTTYADFNRQPSRGNPAGDTTTIPPQAEISRTPFRVPNPNFQHQGPNTPQVENRSNNSAMPSAQSQPQPQPDTSPAPYHPNLRMEVVREQSTVQGPDPRRAGQHVSSPRWGNQGTAPHANHYGVSGDNRTWLAGNGATQSQAPCQGFPHLHLSGNTWRSINGIR